MLNPTHKDASSPSYRVSYANLDDRLKNRVFKRVFPKKEPSETNSLDMTALKLATDANTFDNANTANTANNNKNNNNNDNNDNNDNNNIDNSITININATNAANATNANNINNANQNSNINENDNWSDNDEKHTTELNFDSDSDLMSELSVSKGVSLLGQGNVSMGSQRAGFFNQTGRNFSSLVSIKKWDSMPTVLLRGGSIATNYSTVSSSPHLLQPPKGVPALVTLQPVQSNVPCDVMSKYHDKINKWEFDAFEFINDPETYGLGLTLMAFHICKYTGLLECCEIDADRFWNFSYQVQKGYRNNPYHNHYHACDVLVSTYYYLKTRFMKSHMTIWDEFGGYVAAMVHDVGHDGFNNAFHLATASNLALLYGDASLLENYHVSETFRILSQTDCNWMQSHPLSVRRYLGVLIRQIILGTDMKHHGTNMANLNEIVKVLRYTYFAYVCKIRMRFFVCFVCLAILLSLKLKNNNNNKRSMTIMEESKNEMDIYEQLCLTPLFRLMDCPPLADLSKIEDDGFALLHPNQAIVEDIVSEDSPLRVDGIVNERFFLMEIVVHLADVSNPAKPWEIAKAWAYRVMEEFYCQVHSSQSVLV
ncbi:hypothetical protein RFI_37754 [Reticulomyxa filosa]|uniref:Phosphodiesterase n=1 Tax=Reticulomyxa filosa TaxID=46433 RepID=X6LDT0_RETFI|nr:hypothetical protein RFI_37754 [Reticulomyxa filosa]|eukprot:ETN99713.1 hypothetical protein RFI_37754 [Reticulomyxa filosa]